MDRTTIDFGIDLGTTNSAIAVLRGVATEVIKNNSDLDITPSAVSFDKKGSVQVGQRAKNRIFTAPGDAYGEFKRRMGTDYFYKFKSSGLSKRPEELSAEILKSLRADVQQRIGDDLPSSVITVPAAFELHQCDATLAAAKLAGFKETPLLQEPVAAALAYGFQVEKQKEYWLVYDFGGGTFDAAVIKAEDGTIHVVNHGGDNFLGGSDIDWAIVNRLLVPRLLKEHSLKDFTMNNPAYQPAFAMLKRAAEGAKIELSRAARTTIEQCKFSDDHGDECEFECELTRAEVVGAAEPFIRSSVEICQRVLKEKNLGATAIERIILVGGPTLAPYFRELLTNSLGIQLDHSVDPLTVVARGAAVFAGTQRLKRDPAPAKAGHYTVDLKHKPVGFDSAPMIGGRVQGAQSQDFTGFTVELVNVKTKWSSGKIALRADGVFIANLRAEPATQNMFSIDLIDASGRKQSVTPDTLTYTIGNVVEEQSLPNSMGLALGNNEYHKLFEKGRSLPITAKDIYHSIVLVRKGQHADAIRVPVIEGEHKRADRNRCIGSLEISGKAVNRDLPVNSEIEVTLKMDASRILSVTAYVPILDQEFSTTITLKTHSRDVQVLQREFDEEVHRLRDIKSKAEGAGGDTAIALAERAESSPLMQEVDNLLNAKGNADADKCEKRLLELKAKIDEAADALQWPQLVADAKEWLGYLEALTQEHGTPEQRKRAVQYAADVQSLLVDRSGDELRLKITQIQKAWWEITFEQPAFWVQQISELEKQVASMRDQSRAARLLQQGRAFISQNNATGLQNVVRELWKLLPDEVVEESRRGYRAGIVKASR